MYRTLITGCIAFLLATTAMAQAKARPLDDAALDRVTAGTATLNTGNGSLVVDSLNPTTIGFLGKVKTPLGPVVAIGSITMSADTGSSINISGGALQGAQSMINIIAANSTVNVLTNLVVMINPTNLTINQSNINH